jgi:hypothetical protein
MAQVPRARGVPSGKDTETVEREKGNEEFQAGNFTAAVKSYTKCLGLKVTIPPSTCSSSLEQRMYSITTFN